MVKNVKGKIIKILTQKDNDWGRYIIEEAGKETLIVGVIPGVAMGMTVTVSGHDENTKYGPQFKIEHVILKINDDCSGVRRFLSDGYIKGIGPTKAESIIKAYGKKSLDLFETEEGRRELALVKGITLSVINKCLPSYEASKKYKDIVLFLNGNGTKGQVEKIYSKYGDKALQTIKKNPYRLQMDIDGFGFIKADNIALASGIKPDSIYRLIAAANYVLEEASVSGGHCYLPYSDMLAKVLVLLASVPKLSDISNTVAENALANWTENKEKLIKRYDPCADTLMTLSQIAETRKNISDTFAEALTKAFNDGDLINDDGHIYTVKMFEAERSTAKMIAKMCMQNPVRFISPALLTKCITAVEERKTEEFKENGIHSSFKITEEQKDAVYLGLMHRIAIISGGPGRGKTTIMEIIAHTFLSAGARYDKDDVLMLAPTGRAAQRITESTGYSAMTAQRAILLEQNIKNKLIIVDESSMVDVFLMRKILDFAKDCNLIIVGDADQIASVGPGKVLRDMIDTEKVPYILLKQGHRNSGTIAKNSELINNGMKLDKYTYDKHFVYIPARADNIVSLIISDYTKKVSEYGIKNVMLCAAMRDRGCCSVSALNNTLQDIYTKGKPEAIFGSKRFRVGDRVMQTVNDYNFLIKRNGTLEYGVYNGERGTITNIRYDNENEVYNLTVLFDDNSVGGYTNNTVQNLTLAYATTLHKCQGSEAKCMMMAYTYGDYMLLNRSLFYTGETRAKEEFRFYGEEQIKYGKILSAFDIAVSKTDDSKRNTGLKELICKCIDEAEM